MNPGHMKLALAIAFQQIGKTSPNPAVGAVLVKNEKVIATGGTQKHGSDHAEVVAIKEAIKSMAEVKGSELYVTLEPCCHYGKTPACSDLIVRSGIKTVYVPVLDPNPLVCGNGVASLEKAGVVVVQLKEFEKQALDLIRPFNKSIIQAKPFIINKCAITLDGRIATSSGDSKWISSDYARYIVHKLRAKVDAIIVGKRTVEMDNPRLDARLGSFDDAVRRYFTEKKYQLSGTKNYFLESLLENEIEDYTSPLRVIIGLPENIAPGWNIFHDDNYLVFDYRDSIDEIIKNQPAMKNLLVEQHVVTLENEDNNGMIKNVLNELHNRGILLALLEGGGATNGHFFDAGEIDQFLYTISPRVIGNGIAPINGQETKKMSDSLRLAEITVCNLGDDLLYNAFKENNP